MESSVDIKKKILLLQEKLNNVLLDNKLASPRAYQLSTAIDELIVEYYRQKDVVEI